MKKAGVTVLCILIAVGIFAAGYFGGIFTLMITALFLPMVFVYQRAVTNVTLSVISVIVFGVAAFLLAGVNVAGVLMCCILPSALVVGHAIERKTPFYYSVLASTVSMLASVGILFLCIYLLYDASLLDLIFARAEESLRAAPEATKQLYYLMAQLQGTAQDIVPAGTDVSSVEALQDLLAAQQTAVGSIPMETAVEGILQPFKQEMALLLPQAAAFCVPMFGLLNYLIPRAVYKKNGREAAKIHAFSSWGLPPRFGTWSLFLLILAYIGMYAGWNNFEYVYVVSMGFLNAVYSVQGMAFIDWLLKKRIASRPGRVAIIAVTFVLGCLWNVYMWVGFFEQVVKLRKRELMGTGNG